MVRSTNILGKVATISLGGGSPVPTGITSTITGITTLTGSSDGVTYSGGSGNAATQTEFIELTQTYWGHYIKYQLRFRPITSGTGFSFILKNVDDTTTTDLYFNLATNEMTLTRKGFAVTALNYSVVLNDGIYTLDIAFDYYLTNINYGIKQAVTSRDYGSMLKGNASTLTALYDPRAFNARVAFYGGSAKFFDIEVYSAGMKNCNILGIGDSNMYSNAGVNGYFSKLSKYGNVRMENFSWGGARADQHAAMLNLLLLHNPDRVLLNIGTNDSVQGRTTAAYLADVTTIVNGFVAAGKKVDIMSIFPKSTGSADVPAKNTAIQGLVDNVNVFYIDVYSSLISSGSTPNPALFADTLHLNTAGIAVVLGIVKSYYISLGYQF